MRTNASTRFDVTRRSLLGACALAPFLGGLRIPGAQAAEAVDLDLWTHDQNYIKFFTEIAKQLSEKPDAPLNYNVKVTQAGAPEIVTKALLAYTAGAASPDLLGIEISQFSRFMTGGIAESTLTDLSADTANLRDQFYSQRWDPWTVDGKTFAVDSSYPLCVHYFREDLAKQYEIPTQFETWEEVLKVGGQLAAKHNVALGAIAIAGDAPTIVMNFGILLQQRGGQLFDKDGKLALDSPEAVEVLQLLVDGLKSGAFIGLSDFWGGAGAAVLKQGRSAAYFMPDWFQVYVLEPSVPEQAGKWRIGPMPKFAEGGSSTSVWGGTGFAVSKDKPNAAAASELLKAAYLTEEGQVARYQSIRYLPTMKKAWENKALLDFSDPFLAGQKPIPIFSALAPEAPVQYQSPNWSLAMTELSGSLIRAYNGTISPAEAIKEATVNITQKMR